MSPDAFSPLAIPRLSGPAEHTERERARQRGHAMGYAEGMRAAGEAAAREADRAARERRAQHEELRTAAAAAFSALERAAASFTERADAVAALCEDHVMRLAVELAETILAAEVAEATRSALTASSRALGIRAPGDEATVVLSPRDLATLDRLGAERPDGTRFEASPELSPGDAVVRLRDGEVDLRVATALARARAALAEVAA